MVTPRVLDMEAFDLLSVLGYSSSQTFLPASRIAEAVDQAHVLRRAVAACAIGGGKLHGVYQLGGESSQVPSTSVVYVADAPDIRAADEIHRRIWNQAAVPFLLIRLPTSVRAYSGFRFNTRQTDQSHASGPEDGVLAAAVSFSRVLDELGEFHARAIDDGTLWRQRADDVDSRERVDVRLLRNLEALGKWLRARHLAPDVAHALIGKFVFLRYLRDRGILSKRRLEELGIEGQAFRRGMTLKGFRQLVESVDEWLNGGIFPLPFTGPNAPSAEHVRQVAGVFLGDDAETGQLHLDFRAYDFSYIPIETLSVIYEQFLANEHRDRDAGAFYTPIPVVNFMLAELDELAPMSGGARVLDPACGSGAFLVQCYRRMVERHARDTGRPPRPAELRDILVRRVFGIDRDAEACRVTELSLLLTMLDYIEPPDLRSTPTFKLPTLRGQNIFEGDFFDDSSWQGCVGKGFDWIVGNPPWLQVRDPPKALDKHIGDWLETHSTEQPVVRRQAAEAFAWRALSVASPNSCIGLLLPAMSLFTEQEEFRQRFFTDVDVRRVANFANLRRMLFAGRAEAAAAAMFYTSKRPGESSEVLVYSPLVANQEATRPPEEGTRRGIWAIVLNQSEVHTIARHEIEGGNFLPWKIAMWGTHRDKRLLQKLARRSTLSQLAEDRNLILSEGLQLRDPNDSTENLTPIPQVASAWTLDTTALRDAGRLHVFPANAKIRIAEQLAFARTRGGTILPLRVSEPPHVIVHGGRNYAVFENEFLLVPPRQIGIAGGAKDAALLRALALFLSSDLAAYHQFFDSPQDGIRNGRATLASLRRIPNPFSDCDASALSTWSALHRQIASEARKLDQSASSDRSSLGLLEGEMNSMVYDLFGLTPHDRWLVEDFVHVRRELTDGRVRSAATRCPTDDDIASYASVLRAELDEFLDPNLRRAHSVTAVVDAHLGMVEIRLVAKRDGAARHILASSRTAEALRTMRIKLEQTHAQWLYFDRNLFLYDGESAFILKPKQRVWWTRSQALTDADQLIAETVSAARSS